VPGEPRRLSFGVWTAAEIIQKAGRNGVEGPQETGVEMSH